MSLVSGWMVRSGSALLAAYLAASPAAAQTAGSGSANPNALYRAGNGVTKPQLISKVQPDYTEVARKCGVSGLVVLAIVVNSDGTAQNFRVMKTLGFGLDEKAIEAVSQWRFAPGMKDGEPVRVAATVEVNFHLGERRGEFMWHTGGLEFPAVPGRTAPQAIDGSFPKPAKQPLNESAIFEFTVASNGRVTDIRTVLGGREIVALLQPHLEAWRFEPAMANGAAVAATGRVAFFNGEPDPVLRKSLYPASNPATAAPRTFAPPVVRTAQNPKDGLEYVWIPAGAFMMGCSESDTECAADERLGSGIASYVESNPCLAHVSHETVVELGFENNCVAGIPERRDIVALQLSGGGPIRGSVFPEMEFALHQLSCFAILELVALVGLVLTIDEYAAREPGDQRRVLAAFLVLCRTDLDTKGHSETQEEGLRDFHSLKYTEPPRRKTQ